MSTLQKTPLHHLHVQAGAKMGAFAGFDMPLFYPEGVVKEHLHCRAEVGLFDISHMCHIDITGKQAAALIERCCPIPASTQEIGRSRYTFLLNEQGGLHDDLIVTRLGEEHFLIVANAACAQADLAHIQQQQKSFTDATITVKPCGFIAVQGPKAETVLERLGISVSDMDFMSMKPMENAEWYIARSGYTGEDGFEVAAPSDEIAAFAEKLLQEPEVKWIGLGARDTLRLEAALPLYGQDLGQDITAHEAGLLWAIPKELRTADANYIGAAAISQSIAEGRKRKRAGFVVDGRVPVRSGDLIDASGTIIGKVTSGSVGSTLGKPMVLAQVSADFEGEEAWVEVRSKKVRLQAHALPFVKHNYKR